jgi:DNA-damage-inducible protein J
MGASVLVQARVDEDIKREATEVLDGLGLSVSDVIRMALTKVAREKALPAGRAMSEAAHDAWFRAKVQEALNDPRPGISNEEAKRRMREHRAQAAKKRGL